MGASETAAEAKWPAQSPVRWSGASWWQRAKGTLAAGLLALAPVTEASAMHETVRCTPEHPFWVESRGGESLRQFVAAEELRAGDELSAADGRHAVVAGVGEAPPPRGGSFTTYNLTVAGHHTFCVGAAGLWVHNVSPVKTCKAGTQVVHADVRRWAKDGGLDWDNLGNKRFDKLVEARQDLRRGGLDKVDDFHLASAGKDGSEAMLKDLLDGKITPDDMPTVKRWDGDFFQRPPEYQYRKGKDFPPYMMRRGGKVLHHVMPEYVQEALRDIAPELNLPEDFDLSPGHIMDEADHDLLHKEMRKVLPYPVKGVRKITGDAVEVANALVSFYDGSGHKGQAKLARAWFVKHNILNP